MYFAIHLQRKVWAQLFVVFAESLLFSLPAAAQSLKVDTIAGQAGVPGGVDGAGTAALFDRPSGVASDTRGNVYVTMDQCVRKIAADGQVSTLAGVYGVAGYADGSGSLARFYYPSGIAVDSAGNVYVSDTGRIRKIDPSGYVTTLAGLADNVPPGAVNLLGPLAIDPAGNIYVGQDAAPIFPGGIVSVAIRKITPSGFVTTVAGGFTTGHADGFGPSASFDILGCLATDASGTLYICDHQAIRKMTPDGWVSTVAGEWAIFGSAGSVGTARFGYAAGIAPDSYGNLYVLDSYKRTVQKLSPDGTSIIVAGVPDRFGSTDGTGPVARFESPHGMTIAPSGELYIADTFNHTIRRAVVTRDGDTNGDGVINVADIVYLINHLFAGGPQPVGNGDADHNTLIQVTDVFYLINHLFSNGPPP